MPGVSKIVHKSKEIIYVDYRGCGSEKETISIFRQAKDIICSEPNGVLLLINFEDAFQTPNYLKEAKIITKETQLYVKKRAIVGLKSPTRIIILNTFNILLGDKRIKPFKTLKGARDWLVE